MSNGKEITRFAKYKGESKTERNVQDQGQGNTQPENKGKQF